MVFYFFDLLCESSGKNVSLRGNIDSHDDRDHLYAILFYDGVSGILYLLSVSVSFSVEGDLFKSAEIP